jgi:hypothetical protein
MEKAHCSNLDVITDPDLQVFVDDTGLIPVAAGDCCNEYEPAKKEKAMPSEFRKFIPFVKIDEAKRQVWGIVTAEVPDKDDEVCDYAGSKPYYEAVIAEMKKASQANPAGGDNCFPLRAMHQLDAVGKGIGFDFRDNDREIFMGFEVVDDDAWKKVQKNVYTGFSQGGRKVGEMVPDPVYKNCMRYVANPSECSLVDNPCLASAHFAYVKSDGALELRKFSKVEPTFRDEGRIEKLVRAAVEREVALLKAADPNIAKVKTKRVASEDLASSAFAYVGNKNDPATWELPIKFSSDSKTKSHVRKALARFNQTKAIPAGEKDKTYARVVAAAKQQGIDVALDKAKLASIHSYLRKQARISVNKLSRKKGDVGHTLSFLDSDLGKLAKGMYEVSRLAEYVQGLSYILFSVVSEQEWEEDTDSPLPAHLQENVNDLVDILVEMVQEESQELKEDIKERIHVTA